MTKRELITQLRAIRSRAGDVTAERITKLIDTIKDEGILDVQAPPEVAEKAKLPYVELTYTDPRLGKVTY